MTTNNIFSFRRFMWLFKQSLLLNKKLIGISLIVFAGTLFIFLMLFQNFKSGFWNDKYYLPVFWLFFLPAGILYSGLSFPSFRSKEKSMAYLLLPSSLTEKFAYEIITRIILFITLTPVLFWIIANLEGAIAHYYNPILTGYQFSFAEMFSEMNENNNSKDSSYWWSTYTGIQGILFLFIMPFTGSCYFVKSPVIKTLFTFAMIMGAFALFQYLLFKGLGLNRFK